MLGEQNPLPAAATDRLDGGITALTRLKSRSVVNRISKPCRHRYLGFKVTRNSFWASDKPPYQNASTGSSGDRSVPLGPRGGKSHLTLPAYLTLSHPPLPFHTHSRTVAGTLITPQAGARERHPPISFTSQVQVLLHTTAR